MKRRLITNIALSELCLVFSSLFLYYGATFIFSGDITTSDALFATACIGYGLLSLALLALAWIRPANLLMSVAKYSAIFMFALFVLGSFDTERISRFEWLLIALVGVLLFLNWLTLNWLTTARPRA